jgi:DtxR family Mn-dependent transcriptional regulator
MEAGGIKLTATGRASALHIIRAHRLWEQHLAHETGYAETEWHARAEHREHDLAPAELDTLSARLGHPTHDPHGDPIPTATGRLGSQGGISLTQLPLDRLATIVHVEDEPEIVYAQLAAAGFTTGVRIKILARDSGELILWVEGQEHTLPMTVANNVTVQPLAASQLTIEPEERRSLAELSLYASGVVAGLSPRCRGSERRRFLDLGILPGTKVKAELRSPSGDPTAYRIRGALIALRQDQASMIEMQTLPTATAEANSATVEG